VIFCVHLCVFVLRQSHDVAQPDLKLDILLP
jgi:hypothetical protein